MPKYSEKKGGNQGFNRLFMKGGTKNILEIFLTSSPYLIRIPENKKSPTM
jgi:hypothetical protein